MNLVITPKALVWFQGLQKGIICPVSMAKSQPTHIKSLIPVFYETPCRIFFKNYNLHLSVLIHSRRSKTPLPASQYSQPTSLCFRLGVWCPHHTSCLSHWCGTVTTRSPLTTISRLNQPKAKG